MSSQPGPGGVVGMIHKRLDASRHIAFEIIDICVELMFDIIVKNYDEIFSGSRQQ
jgi:hypothetical protein